MKHKIHNGIKETFGVMAIYRESSIPRWYIYVFLFRFETIESKGLHIFRSGPLAHRIWSDHGDPAAGWRIFKKWNSEISGEIFFSMDVKIWNFLFSWPFLTAKYPRERGAEGWDALFRKYPALFNHAKKTNWYLFCWNYLTRI